MENRILKLKFLQDYIYSIPKISLKLTTRTLKITSTTAEKFTSFLLDD